MAPKKGKKLRSFKFEKLDFLYEELEASPWSFEVLYTGLKRNI
jgi:hypothetical protein